MSKDYKRKNAARRSGGVSKQLLLMLVSFLLGYLSASIFDFTSLSSWVSTQVLLQHTIPADTIVPQQAQLPKPKFEFYTLLAHEHTDANIQRPAPAQAQVITPPTPEPTHPIANIPVINNQPVLTVDTSVVSAKPASSNTDLFNKDAYLVQIASFQSDQEAERLKALLTIKGFRVNVAIVTQQHIQWYRVNLGPFASRTQAEQAKNLIARSEHIVGMVRKMDA